MLSPLIAGALSAAIVAGVTVWIFAQLPGLWVLAAFVGWASYDNSGADRRALFTSSTCVVFGAVMAWLVALVVAAGIVPIASSIASALAAAVASFIIVWISQFLPFQRPCDLLWLRVSVRLPAIIASSIFDGGDDCY
jgi:hypothetical protein